MQKQEQLFNKYFGNLVYEAAIERPETIGEYTKDLPLKIEAEYRNFLEELWRNHTPGGMKGIPFVLEEQNLRKLMTDDDREMIEPAYKKAINRNLWERITKSNHEDVTYYKALLKEYTSDLLYVMRVDFFEEIKGHNIKNKAFHDVEVCDNILCVPPKCEECISYETPFCRYSYVDKEHSSQKE